MSIALRIWILIATHYLWGGCTAASVTMKQ